MGTVGTGVADILLNQVSRLKARSGMEFCLKSIVDIDWSKSSRLDLSGVNKSSNALDIIEDPEIQIVVETIGGYQPAYDFICDCLKEGKHVITANKALIATRGRDLFKLAKDNNVDILFEAAVGGGIPIIKGLREGLVANDINSISGILNGTSNYILTKMHNENVDYDSALKEAQELGFAEADPFLDVSGGDAAHKLAILASIASSSIVDYDSIFTEGITRISSLDIKFAQKLGYTIKLLAICRISKEGLDLRVHPTLISNNHLLASINSELNAVFINSNYVGDTMFYGPGAGQHPTASAVISDMVDLSRDLRSNKREDFSSYIVPVDQEATLVPLENIQNRFYLRLYTYDGPGILAQISGILGDEGVSISSVMQLETHEKDNYVPVVILTHEAKENDMKNAIDKMNNLPFIRDELLSIRLYS